MAQQQSTPVRVLTPDVLNAEEKHSMKFNRGTTFHNPQMNEVGDCFRTSLACLLSLEPSEVPHFMQLYYNDSGLATPEMEQHLRTFLATHGLTTLDIGYKIDGPPDRILRSIALSNGEDICYLLSGLSNGSPHTVVCRGSKILWDPSPLEVGINEPIRGFYWLLFLLPLSMRYNP